MAQSISTEFTDFQRQIINSLSYFSVSLTTVEKDQDGKYLLKGDSIGRATMYFITAFNTFIKLIYLLFLVNGYFGPVDFLDKMCALLWILMCGEIFQELLFYVKRYPLFEVLKDLWHLENVIYNKLGRPKELKHKNDRINLHTAIFHLGILIVGCCMIAIQFIWAPKYSVYTYAAFKEDNLPLLILFTCHEVLFMWQAWTGYLSVVTISSVNAVELTIILDGMTKALNSIGPEETFVQKETIDDIKPKSGNLSSIISVSEALGKVAPIKSSKQKETFKSHASNVKYYGKLSPGTEYTSLALIEDFIKLSIASDLLNDWCSYRIVGVHTIGYCQFISDVFMTIQLLQFAEMDVAAVLWFGEDASVCLFMIFRMFTLMSRVSPASETFTRAVQHYLSYESPMRKQLIKTSKTLRLISLKLGSSPVRPETVGTAVMMLMNYYLVVALWKSN